MRRVGPPRERYKTGPQCGDCGDGGTPESVPVCLYRSISRGYAPLDSPTVTYREEDGTVHETGTPKSDFLFILEALGPDEVALGRNAVGPTGRTFEKLLHENTPLRRSDITLINPVRCRPIVYEAHDQCAGRGCAKCDNGQTPAFLDYNGDNITQKPSFDQVRECSSRYMNPTLETGEFKYIICLGAIAAYSMLGRQVEISKLRGTIFTPGETKQCGMCKGTKTVPGRLRNCKECKGRGTLKCKCGGVTKHKKKCAVAAFPSCPSCPNGKVPGKPKKCPECGGDGVVALDPGNPHVCPRLKPGQLMMITYHPAYLRHNPGMWPVVERDFQRITQMEKELEYAEKAQYDEYPPRGRGIAGEILGVVEDSRGESGLARSGTFFDVEGRGSKAGSGQNPDPLSPLTFDLETTGLDADNGKITHFAFTDRPGYGAVIHPDDERVQQLLFRYPTLVGQNVVLFDWWWLERHGYEIPASTRVVDTRYLGKLINPDTPNDLPYLTAELADPPLRGYWKAKDDYRRHIERVACIDVDATTRVLRGAQDRLERTGQWQFALDYIIPISRVVFEARKSGMKVDKERMEEAQERIDAALDDKRKELPDWGGTRTEGQHAKVQEYLYEKLNLPIQKQRGTWAVTANRHALETLCGYLGRNDRKVQHLEDEDQQEATRFIDLLLELRDMAKLSSGFLRYKYSADHKVHPELNPVGTATLRPTCASPNVLQVPGCKCKPACHGTEKHVCPEGPEAEKYVWQTATGQATSPGKCWGTNPKCKNARWVFIPDQPDWEIMSVDISQAEVIGFLWYAEQWDTLDQILNKGWDAYEAIGAKVFGRDINEEERSRMKVDTLAYIYGEGERTQALRLGIHVKEIFQRRRMYESALPGVADFRDQFISMAMRQGYVESPWGVRRHIRVESKRGRAANEACNAAVQNIPPMTTGFAAIRLHRELPKPARLWTPWVYDELNFVYPQEMRQEVYTAARDILGGPVPQMPAPAIKMGSGLRFRLDFATGKTWGHMQKMEVSS